ncbi:hemolysin family protein [Opitutus sp. GAS368]|jgi:CBS domain containing-hemolysin-like protein|uniref:hemolysin family protein n=1 Tax=Opitutus sp. GAS368 TaxID=1882749 RepID=UPI00087DB76B|nr:hemolysin family protein [Opitutus sp. GAS368]SDR99893.1 Hemolysin, contains CBS domains [Opitutus sp. GAS368]
MHSLLGFSLEILCILALVAANGFFVAAEFALVKVRASQLRPMARTGGWQVRLALKATEHLDAALSATQLGITLASLGLGWVGEPFLAHRLAPLLAKFNVTDPAAVSSISFATAFVVITFLHIIFGELAPKSLAIQRSKGVVLWVAAPLLGFYYVFFPFIWALNGLANLFLRWAGLGPAGEGDHAFSAEELEYVFSHARHSHPGDALINKLMVQSLRARATQARHIMRPRDQVVALWLDQPLAENLRTAQTSGHSRFPVCSGSLDKVEGLLLVREWLWQISVLGPDTPFEPLVREVVEFELTTPLHTMIERFRTSRSHLAVVLDDKQALAGLVTFEDVLEEIVGDIRDEFDIESGPVYERSAHAITVSGTLTMRELQAETGWPLEWTPRETVAAWVHRHLGRVPKRDDHTTVGEYRISVLEANAERARRVKIERAAGHTHLPM